MPKKLQVAGLAFEEFELLDLFGPLEMFGLLRDQIEITIVGERLGPVRSNQGPTTVVEATLADCPPFDVILIPGGWGTRREVNNPALLATLRTVCERTTWVTTVCTGTALLARTGLLDGHRATTNKRAFTWVTTHGPAVHWIAEARWVEDGKYFTSSGVSAGIDMSLAVIARLFDRATALQTASYAEYTWQDDPALDPFASFARPPAPPPE